SHFAFDRNRFARVFRELIVHRFVIADEQIGFAIGYNADWPPALDALGRATGMFITHRVVIDVAHHIDNFARNFFGRRGVEILLALLRSEGERRKRESRNESGCDRRFQASRNCGIEHARNVRSKVAPVNYVTCSTIVLLPFRANSPATLEFYAEARDSSDFAADKL